MLNVQWLMIFKCDICDTMEVIGIIHMLIYKQPKSWVKTMDSYTPWLSEGFNTWHLKKWGTFKNFLNMPTSPAYCSHCTWRNQNTESTVHEWFPIRLPFTLSSYLSPRSKYSTWNFNDLEVEGFKVIWGQKFIVPIEIPSFPVWPPLSLTSYPLPFSWYLTLNLFFIGATLVKISSTSILTEMVDLDSPPEQ